MPGLKGNQDTLHDAVEDSFLTAQANHFNGINYDHEEELDKAHGRLETRRYGVSDVLLTLPDTHKWKGLASIGMVERECLEGNVKSIERRYFISSIPANAKVFANAVRGYWGGGKSAALATGCSFWRRCQSDTEKKKSCVE